MNEKKRRLIESGMKLFSAKGYHNTSIQEIASSAGVSKGAFYLYFESKEQFITTAIHHFYNQMTDKMKRISETKHDAREILEQQITTIIDYIYTYKDFIIMHLRENISVGEQTDKMMEHMQISSFQSLRENIRRIYGEKVNEIIVDVVIQMEGLINSYSKWIVIDDIHVEREKIGPFLVRRLDNIVTGMLQNKEVPLTFIPEKYNRHLTGAGGEELDPAVTILKTMKEKILSMEPGTEKVKKLLAAFQLLETELAKKERQPIMIQGLLAHFREIPEVHQECEQLAKEMKMELLK
ncbi:TetR/AcrR family transcriptional regulator [Oceanobacillus longus]|uniref:TetR/AcrR family transcriptional regulator n=1 Tax=Oceanobacillus longus TaxID=930120 RepID=A0ABV8H2B1_9BACI